jgi:uncharacterized protein YecT (DUF1311 family)
MRVWAVGAFLLLATAGAAQAAAADLRASQAACNTDKLGGRELAECLRTATERSERDLATTMEAAAKSIDSRQGVMSSQKSRWRRALNEAESQWVNWRDVECQDVAPFEAGISARGGADPRLACIIDANAARMAGIKARYP